MVNRRPLTRRLAQFMPYAATLAMVVLAVLAYQSIGEQRRQVETAIRNDLEGQIEAVLNDWETDLREGLDEVVETALEPDQSLRLLQERTRSRARWFERLYVWTPKRPELPLTQFRFPTSPTQVQSGGACMQTMRRAISDRRVLLSTTFVELERYFWRACRSAPPDIQVQAALEVAYRLKSAKLPEAALAFTELPPYSPDALITAGLDVTVARRARWRMMRGDLLASLDDVDRGARLLAGTAYQILDLDAPSLEISILLVQPIVQRLLDLGMGAEASRIGTVERKVESRLAAYREVVQAAERPTSSSSTEGSTIVYDQFGMGAYLLYVQPAQSGIDGVALQLDQQVLLDDLLNRTNARFRNQIVIRDVTGRTLAGPQGSTPAISVKFPQLLKHLELGVLPSAVDARVTPLLGRSYFFTLTITSLCIIFGLAAIYSLQQSNERHRMLLRRQRDFTARVTHELKTPLTGIKAMAENLLMGAYRDDQQKDEMANRIIAEADRLNERVDEILTVSRKRELPTKGPFDMEEIVLEALYEWIPRYEVAKVKLQADLAATAEVFGDGEAMRDAINCLLDNALKYRRESRSDCQVLMSLEEDGAYMELVVLDNGLGVPKDQRDAIFERFARVEGDNRGTAGGHGLGLAQVADIVAAHKGTVTCTDGLDGGSRFTIRVPIYEGS